MEAETTVAEPKRAVPSENLMMMRLVYLELSVRYEVKGSVGKVAIERDKQEESTLLYRCS